MLTVPEATLDVTEHARNSVIRVNQRIEQTLNNYVTDFEDFWGVSGRTATETVDEESVEIYRPNGSKYTNDQMQAKLDAMGKEAVLITLSLAAALRDLIIGAEAVLGQSVLADRYKAPAFNLAPINSPADPVTVIGINDAWAYVADPEPEVAPE